MFLCTCVLNNLLICYYVFKIIILSENKKNLKIFGVYLCFSRVFPTFASVYENIGYDKHY